MTQTTTPDTLPEVSIPCAECEIPINPETAGSLRLCADCTGDYERWLSRLTPAEQACHLCRTERAPEAVGFAAHITAFDGPRLAPGIVQTEYGPRWDHRTAPAVYRVIYREDEQENGEPGRYRLSHSHETFATYADAKRYADPIHPSRAARILRDVTESEASR